MKKMRYSAGMKGAAVAAEHILTVILMLCLLLLVLLYQKNILNFSDKKDTSFEDSSYFSDQFKETAKELVEFIGLCKKFETDGVFDEDKLVDIWQYSDRQDISDSMVKKNKKNLGLYTLGDLAEWSREYGTSHYEFVSEYHLNHGIQQIQSINKDGESVYSEEKTINSLEEMIPEFQEDIVQNVEHFYGGSYSTSMGKTTNGFGYGSQESYEFSGRPIEDQEEEGQKASVQEEETESQRAQEVIQKVIAGDLYKLTTEELVWLLQDMEMEYASRMDSFEFVNEDYLPKGGNGIWNNFMRGDFTLEQMQGAYQALMYTLENISQEIGKYRKYTNNYKQNFNKSNLSYWMVQGKKGNVYTNMNAAVQPNFSAYGEKVGKYLYYQEKDGHLETNVKDMQDYFYQYLEPLYGNKGNAVFVGVNTKFLYGDRFQEAKTEYNRMYPWIQISLWGAVVSFLLELILMLYLSIVAGKRDDTGQVYLNLFDRIPTEILFLFAAVTTIVFIWIAGRLFYRFDNGGVTRLLLLSGGFSLFGTSFMLVFYLSFVRRIRAGVLWSNSIVCWFFHGIGLLFTSSKSSTKMIIWFGVHVLLCVFILPMLVNYDTDIFLLGAILFALLSGVEGVLIIREGAQRNKVLEGISKISSGDLEYKITEEELKGENRKLAEAVNAIGDGLYHAVDDSMKNERLQVDLITNVSHDIKTPLTSIINYVDLLKREDLQNERARSYIAVLESKSQRLKQLAEDLVEVSRITSGNITLNMERINLVELIYQTEGEFAEKFEARGLNVISKLPKESVIILADGRRIWRVLENLYNNVAKYAMEHTRVYVDMHADGTQVLFSIKNISENPLNIQAEELTERFIRGDVSRSTEGSGLGLSIAKNLTMLMGGAFQIYLDGDLFKVMISFRQEPEVLELPEEIGEV